MSTTNRSTKVLPFQPSSMRPAQLAAVSFLPRYSGAIHALYRRQLGRWFAWCTANGLDPLAGIQRAHVELYIREFGEAGLMDSSVITMMHAVRATSGSRTSTAPSRAIQPCLPGSAVLRVLGACRGERTTGPLVLRPLSGKPIDRRDVYRMVRRVARMAQISRHLSPHSLRPALITNALDAGVPRRDAQILARHADPKTIEHYDLARGNLDRHGVHFLTAYVAGV